MYYGYRCYTNDNEALGWFYTTHKELELNWTTNPDLFYWCKRWKTKRGAEKNFDYYQRRWKSYRRERCGYLKIEIMPEVPSIDENSNRTSQQKWDAKNGKIIEESKAKYEQKNPIWSFRPPSELIEWLEEERWYTEDGKPETNSQLLIRKLNKLKNLECQSY
ncbi:hypothetical protein cce_5110 [Crocosphaera subtropica ATCC 51142]|uniref:Uncharacterized protein n=1 Tax=Crocosphaera subtropica (strain ATCC 51142 / BH68) TaxID=43989 RepID=B1X2U5_CROS5|nr:hypothetical protein [Crocosphaera subtropica]ACB54456.1 hypothetical protein cce_5110 [Crocosphaera subtropica ATCC 51142]